MERILEPELMSDKIQAEAYADADFEKSDQFIIDSFDSHFPSMEKPGNILDLGCGPGNITFKFATRFPNTKIMGIDGSIEMIRLANDIKSHSPQLLNRVSFIKGLIPNIVLPIENTENFDAIVSNSLLHHLHQPAVLWNTIKQHASTNTKIFIVDLFRPPSKEKALAIVKQYAFNEPEILQHDFYNSLLAAFTPIEIKQQLQDAGLTELKLETISDRHILIAGKITE